MVKFELSRLLKSKLVRIALFLLFALYIALTVYVTKGMSETRKVDKQVNQYFSEFNENDSDSLLDVLEEKASALEDIVFLPENSERIYTEKGTYGDTLYSDYYIAISASAQAKYLYKDYPDKMIEVVNFSLRQIAQQEDANSYTVKENQKAVKLYNQVRNFQLISCHGMDSWYSASQQYRYFNIFLLLVILVISVDCFSYERNHSMAGFVFSTFNGRTKLFLSKLLTMLIFAVGIMLIITLSDFAIAFRFMGMDALMQPIQATSIFQSAPASITILGFMLAQHGLLLLLMCVIIGICAAVCTVIKNNFAAMIVSALPIAISIGVWTSAMQYNRNGSFNPMIYERFKALRTWLPICLTDSSHYFLEFDYFNLFGEPLNRLMLCVISSVIIFLVTVIFATSRFGKPKLLRG